MGTTERRDRERNKLRQKILDVALAIIVQEGFAALSMRKLAERIEYSAASIYLHFENRDQLAQELRHVGFVQLLEKMEEAARKLTGRKALQAIGAAYVSFGMEQPELYRLMFMGDRVSMQAAYAQMAFDATADRAHELLRGVVQTLRGTSKREATLIKIADVIWSSLHGMVSLYLALPGLQSTDLKAQQQLALELLASGLEKTSVVPRSRSNPERA